MKMSASQPYYQDKVLSFRQPKKQSGPKENVAGLLEKLKTDGQN